MIYNIPMKIFFRGIFVGFIVNSLWAQEHNVKNSTPIKFVAPQKLAEEAKKKSIAECIKNLEETINSFEKIESAVAGYAQSHNLRTNELAKVFPWRTYILFKGTRIEGIRISSPALRVPANDQPSDENSKYTRFEDDPDGWNTDAGIGMYKFEVCTSQQLKGLTRPSGIKVFVDPVIEGMMLNDYLRKTKANLVEVGILNGPVGDAIVNAEKVSKKFYDQILSARKAHSI